MTQAEDDARARWEDEVDEEARQRQVWGRQSDEPVGDPHCALCGARDMRAAADPGLCRRCLTHDPDPTEPF